MTLNSNKMDMVNGPLLKNIMLFAIPLMATNLLQMLFNAADTIIVGKFAGKQALAAVGATGSLIFLITTLFSGFSVGANVVIAHAIGSNEHHKVITSVHTSIFMGLFGGLLLTFIGMACSRSLLSLMSTPLDIIDSSALYMRIIFFGAMPNLLYTIGSAILRSKGDTKRPLYFLAIAGVINVVLNYISVVWFHMGVSGVAIATIVSQFIACVLVLYILINSNDDTKLHIKQLKYDKEIGAEILKIGIPAGIQGMAFSISNVVIQSSINSFNSSIIIAGNSAASNIESFVYIGMVGFTQAAMTFTSQNIGAKKYHNILNIMIKSLILTFIMALGISIMLYAFGDNLLSFYTDDLNVIEIGKIRLLYVTTLLVLNGILDVFVNSMRGMRYSFLPTVIMIAGVCGVRIIWLMSVFKAYPTLEVIYMCYPISWIITSIFEAILWVYIYRKVCVSQF